MDIFKRISENEISLTKPRAYEVVPTYLWKTPKVMGRMEKEEPSPKYIAGLRRAMNGRGDSGKFSIDWETGRSQGLETNEILHLADP